MEHALLKPKYRYFGKLKCCMVCMLLMGFVCLCPALLQAEDVLRLLVWEGYAPPDYVQKFERQIEKDYDRRVELKVTYVSRLKDFYDGVRSKRADIISPPHNLLKDERFRFIKNKLVQPIDLDNIPNYQNLIPSLQKADYITSNGKVYGVPLSYGPYGLAYNTEKFDKMPETWNVLWDPANAGKYTLSADYYENNVYISALAMGYRGSDIYDLEILQQPAFKQKLRQLAANAHSFWQAVDKPEDLYGLSLATSWGFALPGLKKRGEVWKMARVKEGAPGWIDNFIITHAVTEGSFLKLVAEKWLNFILSPEFQVNVFVKRIGIAPSVTNVKDMLSDQQVRRFHLNDPDTYFKEHLVLYPNLTVRERNALKVLWRETAGEYIAQKEAE